MNKIVKTGPGKLKQLIRPVHGFKTLKAAYATIKGFEIMRTAHAGAFNITGGQRLRRGTPRRRAFGLDASALSGSRPEIEGRGADSGCHPSPLPGSYGDRKLARVSS